MAKIKDLDGRVENRERTEKGKGKKRGGGRKTARKSRIMSGDAEREKRAGCMVGGEGNRKQNSRKRQKWEKDKREI